MVGPRLNYYLLIAFIRFLGRRGGGGEGGEETGTTGSLPELLVEWLDLGRHGWAPWNASQQGLGASRRR